MSVRAYQAVHQRIKAMLVERDEIVDLGRFVKLVRRGFPSYRSAIALHIAGGAVGLVGRKIHVYIS